MTGKQLPLQMLRMFLNRAVESAIENQNRARGLATTLERHAVRLRLVHGGKSLLTSAANPPKEKRMYWKSKSGPPPAGDGYERADCDTCKKVFFGNKLVPKTCFHCKNPVRLSQW